MQLVELQETVVNGHEDIAVFAVSYDPVEILADFAESHGITYSLLGDVGSHVMEELGLLNEDMEAERAYWGRTTEERHHRLPYPATFVLDHEGVVVEKIIERSHRNRPSGRVLLEDLGYGEDEPEVRASAAGDGVVVSAWAPTAAYFPNQIFRVGVRIGVAEGLHLYVPPTAGGYVTLDVSIEGPAGVYWDPPALPEGEPFRVAGLDERFSVVDGTIDLAIPVHIHEDVGDVTLGVVVRYQACSDEVCLMPETLRLELPLHSRGKL